MLLAPRECNKLFLDMLGNGANDVDCGMKFFKVSPVDIWAFRSSGDLDVLDVSLLCFIYTSERVWLSAAINKPTVMADKVSTKLGEWVHVITSFTAYFTSSGQSRFIPCSTSRTSTVY